MKLTLFTVHPANAGEELLATELSEIGIVRVEAEVQFWNDPAPSEEADSGRDTDSTDEHPLNA